MDALDEDAPLELMWQELRASPLWQNVERMLIEKRDRMVALMVVERPKPGTEVALAYAEIQRRIGYIEAVNALVAEPARQEEKARKERVNA